MATPKNKKQPNAWQYLRARIKVAWRHFCKKLSQKWQKFLRYFRANILHAGETMAIRHDYCRAQTKTPRYTVIFLHGIASSFNTWREILKELEDNPALAELRFVGLDLIGYGHSPSPKDFEYDYEAYRQSLNKSLKKLRINSPIVLVGHSMGSLIAMDYALENPGKIEQLVLVSPPILRRGEIAGLKDKIHQKIYSELGQNADEDSLQKLADLVGELTQFDNKSFKTPAFKKCMENIILNPQNWRRSFSLKTPTVIIHGRFDPLVIGENLRSIANRKPSVDFVQTLGTHAMTGPKAKKIVKIITELLS